jgi:hypothetical protein
MSRLSIPIEQREYIENTVLAFGIESVEDLLQHIRIIRGD